MVFQVADIEDALELRYPGALGFVGGLNLLAGRFRGRGRVLEHRLGLALAGALLRLADFLGFDLRLAFLDADSAGEIRAAESGDEHQRHQEHGRLQRERFNPPPPRQLPGRDARGFLLGRGLAAFQHFVQRRAEQRDDHDNHRQRADGRVDAVPHFAGQESGQRALGDDGEHRGVVVLERREERQHRGRQNRRLEKRQEDFAKGLHMRRAQVQRRFFLRHIKTLQARDENQHGVRGDESRLADDGEKETVVKNRVARGPEHGADAVPKQQRGNAEHHAGDQNRRDDDGVIPWADALLDLGQHQRAGQTQRHRQQHYADADEQTVAQAFDQLGVVRQHIKPFDGEAFERRHARERRGVERGHAHDDERPEQVREETQYEQRRETIAHTLGGQNEPGSHRAISPSLTLNTRIISSTNRMQTTSRMMAYAEPRAQLPAWLNA